MLNLFDKIILVEIAWVRRHDSREPSLTWKRRVYGLPRNNDEVVPGTPDDPAIRPFLLITNQRYCQIDHETLLTYVVTDLERYWYAAVWCMNPYLTMDVMVRPTLDDVQILKCALKEYGQELLND